MSRCRHLPRLLAFALPLFLLLSLTSLTGKAHALTAAAGPKPPTATSYYMDTTDPNVAFTRGCTQGQQDRASLTDSMVVLDFGAQLSNGSGTLEARFSQFTFSNAQIQAVVEGFALGYFICTGSDTTTLNHIGVGTNNSGPVSFALGQDWANLVNAISTQITNDGLSSQVVIEGANDIEPGFGAAAPAIAWSQGYASVPGVLYLNYGSADGCPQTSDNNGSCNNGWNQFDVWYVSWGSPPAFTTPEIYFAPQAAQWQELSLYGAQHQNGAAIFYEGPLDEFPLDNTTFTSSQAWTTFSNDLNSNALTAQNMPFSLEINQEN